MHFENNLKMKINEVEWKTMKKKKNKKKKNERKT